MVFANFLTFSPPLVVYMNDFEKEENDLQAIIECRRLLLQAGADPTLRDPEGEHSLLLCAADGTVVSIWMLDFYPIFKLTSIGFLERSI